MKIEKLLHNIGIDEHCETTAKAYLLALLNIISAHKVFRCLLNAPTNFYNMIYKSDYDQALVSHLMCGENDSLVFSSSYTSHFGKEARAVFGFMMNIFMALAQVAYHQKMKKKNYQIKRMRQKLQYMLPSHSGMFAKEHVWLLGSCIDEHLIKLQNSIFCLFFTVIQYPSRN